MPDSHANFAYSLVATAPSPPTSGTSLDVTAAEGALFPAVPFNATVWPAGVQPLAANAEIVRVTGRATDTLTIARAQEGSSARTVVVGDQIAATVTTKTLTDAENVTVSTIAATGATETVDFAVASIHDLTLDLSCTLTLTGGTSGKEFGGTLLLRQDATGGRLVTWPGSVTWLSGHAPVLRTAASAVDVVDLFTVNGGTTWFGMHATVGAGLLGSASITSTFGTTSDTPVQVTGLSVTVTAPGVGSLMVMLSGNWINNTVNLGYAGASIWDGTVGSGTQIAEAQVQSSPASANNPVCVFAIVSPAAGSKTYNVGLTDFGAGGTAQLGAAAGAPAILAVLVV